jgi:hypothetical protein
VNASVLELHASSSDNDNAPFIIIIDSAINVEKRDNTSNLQIEGKLFRCIVCLCNAWTVAAT